MNNFNQYLQPFNAPVTQPRAVPAMQFEDNNEVQTRNVRLSSIQLNKMQFVRYNSSTNTIIISVPITFGSAVTYNQTVTFNGTVAGLVKETRFELMEEGAFTGNDSFEFGGGPAQNQYAKIRLVSSEWDSDVVEFYYEFIGNGDGASSLISQLYDVTNGSAVANTQGTTTTSSDGQRIRCGPFTLNSGTCEYAMQYKRSVASDFPAAVSAGIIVRYK